MSSGNPNGTVQEKAQHHLSNLDKELSRYSYLNQFEQQTSVPKVYVVLGLGALYFFLIFFNIAGEFLVNTAGFALPAYYSLEALFSSGKADDTQWLTYWVVYAFFTVVESALNAVYWFPFYYTFKFVFIIWMALPQTGGAQIVFRSLLQPVFARFFQDSRSTSEQLRSQADKATSKTQ
ncbi:ER membrane protein DP1/Yop1 [Oleoguttula mirabilis]|uniref:Protein YOP1 n=1 Tax=Oleoguttula mirabilis TaxID=1507867 RepID=A0AAV9JD81_9PEZI|nr:ER membrane protein DP1/Yop1 [Oleoguttula mirabilis]